MDNTKDLIRSSKPLQDPQKRGCVEFYKHSSVNLKEKHRLECPQVYHPKVLIPPRKMKFRQFFGLTGRGGASAQTNMDDIRTEDRTGKIFFFLFVFCFFTIPKKKKKKKKKKK